MERLHILVFDQDEQLGALAVRLMRAGTDVLYAKHRDEAKLLIRQSDTCIRALMVAPNVDPEDARDLVAEACDSSELGLRALIVVGKRQHRESLEALSKLGAEWALVEPFDDSELRFVVNTAVALPSELSSRREPRAPCTSFAWLRVGARQAFGVFYSISASGAFIETPNPPERGTHLQVEFDLDGRHYRMRGEVIYVNAQLSSRNLPCGIGVRFEGFPESEASVLRHWCQERAARYTL